MAKFLNTSGANYFLEDLIKNSKDRLILISPFLKLNDRIKELLGFLRESSVIHCRDESKLHVFINYII